MLVQWRPSKLVRHVGLDLGTTTVRLYLEGKGIILEEPSVVAIHRDTRRLVAIGEAAKQMVGRTPPHLVTVAPLRAGNVVDASVTERLLHHCFSRVQHRAGIFRPRVLISISSGMTEIGRRALIDAAVAAGAKSPEFIEKPVAAAMGAGIPQTESRGRMVVDIGGGTCDAAVLSMGRPASLRSTPFAGNEMDAAIARYVRRTYHLIIGELTAEHLKRQIGTADMHPEHRTLEARGRDVVTGLPKRVMLTTVEMRNALAETVEGIVSTVRITLERTPPWLVADIREVGITLVGGGALLRGLARRLSAEIGLPVVVGDRPLLAAALGTGTALGNPRLYKPKSLGPWWLIDAQRNEFGKGFDHSEGRSV